MRYNTRDRCREKGKEDWRRRSEMGKEKEKGGRRRWWEKGAEKGVKHIFGNNKTGGECPVT